MSSSLRRRRTEKRARHTLTSSIRALPGVGERRQALLGELGLLSIGDLLVFPPRRYIDRASFASIRDLTAGAVQSVMGRVKRGELKQARGRCIFVLHIEDDTGAMQCAWFNQPYLKNVFRRGENYVFSGKVEIDRFGIRMAHPEYEPGDRELLHTGRIVPVYTTRSGLGQKALRNLVRHAIDLALEDVLDHLPRDIRLEAGLPDLSTAIRHLHFPENMDQAEEARRRMAMDEALLLQTLFALARTGEKPSANGVPAEEEVPARLASALPYRLTTSQSKALATVLRDIADHLPMRRLLQGDVGCGKTVVAALAAVAVCDRGGRAVLMCPTELLAEQHYATMSGFFEPFGLEVGLLTGSLNAGERAGVLRRTAAGELALLVGTHALIGSEDLGDPDLVMVDEEQRFGVIQRNALLRRAPRANLLVISATPIPRTLALTAYGDLDLTVIDELPPGRGAHTSFACMEARREEVMKRLAEKVAGGIQGFHVCPSLTEGEGGLRDVASARREWEKLLCGRRGVEVLTGRTGREERARILAGFRSGETGMLAATSVIEVGMDIPSATLLVVDMAERFGLSQLHQMRGRVARTDSPSSSYFIVSGDAPEKARDRVAVLEGTFDGFVVAEQDLVLRGPGDMIGTRQHGVPDLRFARLPGDTDLVLLARREAFRRVREGDRSPEWLLWLKAVSNLTEERIPVM
jgi:ATP-dependent DNA helicase RecG